MRSIARRVFISALVCAAWCLFAPRLEAEDDRRLIDAVQHHDLAETRALLDQRVDVNARADDGATALHWAVLLGRYGSGGPAVKARRDGECGQRARRHPVALASANGNADLVSRLIAEGGETTVSEGVPPLMSAARVGSVETVRRFWPTARTSMRRNPPASRPR